MNDALIEPFQVRVPEAAVADLAERLAATRWGEDAFDGDWRFGAPLPFVKDICARWRSSFDWRAVEARIADESGFVTQLEGLRLHFLHRVSPRTDAVPLLLLHGWPGSFIDNLDLIAPLALPADDRSAFHVVVPSLPGYGFSTTRPGTTPQRVAAMLAELMARLGYERFMIQGGNWGSLIGTEIARQFPERVIGLHLSSISGSAPPESERIALSDEEKSWLSDHANFPHFALFSQEPVTLAHALNDSPAGLAACVAEKYHDWADNGAGGCAIPFDRMLATISLYWFTRSIASSVMLYYEMVHDLPAERFVTVPTAVAIFPNSVARLPRAWAARHYNIEQWTVFAHGGHFPALEAPDVLVGDLRRFAASLATR